VASEFKVTQVIDIDKILVDKGKKKLDYPPIIKMA
jgi:hypothetical protein